MLTANQLRIALAAAGVSLLVGCSSKPDMPKDLVETFTTDILADDSKRFGYALSLPSADDRRRGSMDRAPGAEREQRGGRQGGRGQGGQGGRDQGEDPRDRRKREQGMYEHLIEKLDAKIASTGYCKEGYFVLETYVGQMDYLVEGECNDSATEQDREKFTP